MEKTKQPRARVAVHFYENSELDVSAVSYGDSIKAFYLLKIGGIEFYVPKSVWEEFRQALVSTVEAAK